MTDFRIIRYNLTPTFTEGIWIQLATSLILCDTLEDAVRDYNKDGDLQDPSEQKIYAETAIPYSKPGTPYKLRVTYSHRFMKKTVEIMGVPEFTYIRAHWGRTQKNSAGCVLVGQKEERGVLLDTGMTDKLVEILEENGGEGTLEII